MTHEYDWKIEITSIKIEHWFVCIRYENETQQKNRLITAAADAWSNKDRIYIMVAGWPFSVIKKLIPYYLHYIQ